MAHVIDFKEAGFDSVLDELEWRGLISQSTDRDRLAEALNGEPITYYCGFDPTAASLHIGNLVQLINMRHLQAAGHHPIALVGGATGLIGDPRQSGERTLNPKDVVAGWADRLKKQIGGILDTEGSNPVRFVSNYDWTASMNVIDFLRDVGKNFRMGTMLAKDTVARRLNSEEGISFTEFSYQVLQGNDFLHLFDEYHCVLEIGGSDQWGNLTSGMDLTRRLHQAQVYGMTLPLITKADGTKFGKTEGGAVWLDPALTSPYAFYQFWLGTADEDVYRFLRYYSFMPLTEIEALEAEDAKRQGRKLAQQVLADELTELVHGKGALAAVQRISELLFSGEVARLGESDLAQLAQDGMPSWRIEGETSLVTLLVECGLANSKRIARELLAAGAISLNGEIRRDEPLTAADRLFGRYLLLRRGKKQYRLVTWLG